MLHRRVSITATTGAVGRPELSLTERRVEIFDRGSHFAEVRTRDIVSGHALSNARNVIQRVTERQLLSEIGVGQETNRRLDCRQLSRWPADWSSASRKKYHRRETRRAGRSIRLSNFVRVKQTAL